MAMTKTKIAGLRDMAKYGTGNEKAVAISILTKAGIALEEPKKSFEDRLKSAFKMNIVKKWKIKIRFSSDVLLVERLMGVFVKSCTIELSLKLGYIHIQATETEAKEIIHVFSKKQNDFSDKMATASTQFINSYF